MKNYIFLFFILFNLLTLNILSAQSRFGGGVVMGFNAAQMDGDRAAGYHKVGLNGGLRGIIRLNETGEWLLTTELLYSQRGARSVENDFTPIWKATFNYIEVPVMISLLDWAKNTEGGDVFYKMHFTAGLTYGRLFSTKINGNFPFPREAVDLFNKNDIGYTLGMSYFATKHWGFTGRYTRSFNKIFNPRDYKTDPVLGGLNALQGYYLTFQTAWIF